MRLQAGRVTCGSRRRRGFFGTGRSLARTPHERIPVSNAFARRAGISQLFGAIAVSALGLRFSIDSRSKTEDGVKMTGDDRLGLPLSQLPELISFCLLPLAASVAAWSLERKRAPAVSNLRMTCFHAGIIIGILGLVVTVLCWINPFPYRYDGTEEFDWIYPTFWAALCALVVSIVLALFGRGWPRALLIVSGVLTLFL